MRQPINVVLAVTCACFSAGALGAVVDYAQLPYASVQQLQTCGEWQSDGRSGQFRWLKVYLYGQDMLFVDMVRPNDAGTQMEVERGLAIAEFNDDHAEMELRDIRCKAAGTNRINLSGKAINGHSGKTTSFEIQIDAAGRYKFSSRVRP